MVEETVHEDCFASGVYSKRSSICPNPRAVRYVEVGDGPYPRRGRVVFL